MCSDDGRDCVDVDPMTMLCRACGAHVIGPMSEPQRAFLESRADIAIYGGGAGGGKTWMLALDAAQDHDRPGFSGVIFRRTSPELVGGGSIWEATQAIYRHLGGVPRTSPTLDWRFPLGAMIELRHLQHESDVYSHQGKQYACIGFDELTHFEESQFWYLVSRMRTTCGIRPRLRATCNPDPDSFVRRLIDWWIGNDGYAIPERSGVLRWFSRREDDTLDWADSEAEVRERNPGRPALSFTFVPARLADNPVLIAKDPGYSERLDSLPKVERDRLKGGDWNSRIVAGSYFRRPMFDVIEHRPLDRDVKRRFRAWDKAATAANGSNDPDWTVGVLVAELHAGGYVVEHVERLRGAPAAVDATMLATAKLDGAGVEILAWQDPGQAGVVDVEHMRTLLKGFRFRAVRSSRDKITYAGFWQTQAEGRRIQIVRGPWNEPYLSCLESFPDGKHDDDVDATSLAFQGIFGGIGMADQLSAYARGFA